MLKNRTSRRLTGLALWLLAGAWSQAGLATGVLEFADPRLNLLEGDSGEITVLRSGDASGDATAVLNVSLGGTAALGNDFTVALPLGVVRVPAGQYFARVPLDALQNTAVDGTRYATLALANPSGATLGRETALLLQIEDDEAPDAELTLPGAAVRRVIAGSELPIDVAREGLDDQVVSATLLAVPGTAGLGIDFSDLTSTVEFAGGEDARQALLSTVDRTAPLFPRTLTVVLATPTPEDSAAFTGLGPLVVIEEPAEGRAGEFSIFTATPSVQQADGSVVFTVDRNRGSTGAATVDWVTVDGSGDGAAAAGRDYVAASGALVFADGETRKTFEVSLVADPEDDRGSRQFLAILAAPSALAGIDPEGRAAAVTIVGDEDSGDDCKGFCDCFIATAAFGSWMHPHVSTLRAFRDDVLMTTAPGRAFVAFYYRHSPPVAEFISRHAGLRALTRAVLAPVVLAVSHPLACLLGLGLAILGGLNLRHRRARTRGT